MLPLSKLGRAGLAALARHAVESTSGAQAEMPWRHAAVRAYSAALPQLAEGTAQRVWNYLRRPGRSPSLFIVVHARGNSVRRVPVQAEPASVVLVAIVKGPCACLAKSYAARGLCHRAHLPGAQRSRSRPRPARTPTR